MHDKAFDNQRDLTDANFVKWAKELGLNMKQFNKDLLDKDIANSISAMQAQGNALGARGTPAFFVNGRFLSGAQPASAFEAVIDVEMTKAKALLATGVARSGVYEKTIESGPTKP